MKARLALIPLLAGLAACAAEPETLAVAARPDPVADEALRDTVATPIPAGRVESSDIPEIPVPPPVATAPDDAPWVSQEAYPPSDPEAPAAVPPERSRSASAWDEPQPAQPARIARPGDPDYVEGMNPGFVDEQPPPPAAPPQRGRGTPRRP